MRGWWMGVSYMWMRAWWRRMPAKESVIKGAPALMAALKRAYQATESKLGERVTTPESYQAVNDRMMSQSDPDAALVRRGRAIRGHVIIIIA